MDGLSATSRHARAEIRGPRRGGRGQSGHLHLESAGPRHGHWGAAGLRRPIDPGYRVIDYRDAHLLGTTIGWQPAFPAWVPPGFRLASSTYAARNSWKPAGGDWQPEPDSASVSLAYRRGFDVVYVSSGSREHRQRVVLVGREDLRGPLRRPLRAALRAGVALLRVAHPQRTPELRAVRRRDRTHRRRPQRPAASVGHERREHGDRLRRSLRGRHGAGRRVAAPRRATRRGQPVAAPVGLRPRRATWAALSALAARRRPRPGPPEPRRCAGCRLTSRVSLDLHNVSFSYADGVPALSGREPHRGRGRAARPARRQRLRQVDAAQAAGRAGASRRAVRSAPSARRSPTGCSRTRPRRRRFAAASAWSSRAPTCSSSTPPCATRSPSARCTWAWSGPRSERRVDDTLRHARPRGSRRARPVQPVGRREEEGRPGFVLSIDPEVLLFDEPTAGLDPRTQDWLIDLCSAAPRPARRSSSRRTSSTSCRARPTGPSSSAKTTRSAAEGRSPGPRRSRDCCCAPTSSTSTRTTTGASCTCTRTATSAPKPHQPGAVPSTAPARRRGARARRARRTARRADDARSGRATGAAPVTSRRHGHV